MPTDQPDLESLPETLKWFYILSRWQLKVAIMLDVVVHL